MMMAVLSMLEKDVFTVEMVFYILYAIYFIVSNISTYLEFSFFQTENIVLMGEFPNCDIKLCDLEVARVIQQGETITEWVGTLDYMGKYIHCKSSFFYIDRV